MSNVRWMTLALALLLSLKSYSMRVGDGCAQGLADEEKKYFLTIEVDPKKLPDDLLTYIDAKGPEGMVSHLDRALALGKTLVGTDLADGDITLKIVLGDSSVDRIEIRPLKGPVAKKLYPLGYHHGYRSGDMLIVCPADKSFDIGKFQRTLFRGLARYVYGRAFREAMWSPFPSMLRISMIVGSDELSKAMQSAQNAVEGYNSKVRSTVAFGIFSAFELAFASQIAPDTIAPKMFSDLAKVISTSLPKTVAAIWKRMSQDPEVVLKGFLSAVETVGEPDEELPRIVIPEDLSERAHSGNLDAVGRESLRREFARIEATTQRDPELAAIFRRIDAAIVKLLKGK